eukprot:2202478-Amphidinium_carterae.2
MASHDCSRSLDHYDAARYESNRKGVSSGGTAFLAVRYVGEKPCFNRGAYFRRPQAHLTVLQQDDST